MGEGRRKGKGGLEENKRKGEGGGRGDRELGVEWGKEREREEEEAENSSLVTDLPQRYHQQILKHH